MFLVIRPDGRIEDLYEESLGLEELGPQRVARASHVEHDESRQAWEVEVAATGERIFSDRSRARCIEFEKEYFRKAFLEGLRPF
jgi:hypothetical protein